MKADEVAIIIGIICLVPAMAVWAWLEVLLPRMKARRDRKGGSEW